MTRSDVPDVRVAASWGSADILYAAVPGGIYRVPATGGAAVLERGPDQTHNEMAFKWP